MGAIFDPGAGTLCTLLDRCDLTSELQVLHSEALIDELVE